MGKELGFKLCSIHCCWCLEMITSQLESQQRELTQAGLISDSLPGLVSTVP